MSDILLDDSALENGLALMIKDLISQNIMAHPERSKDLNRLNGNIAIVARDIGVSLTLNCKKGVIVLYDGAKQKCKLQIETDSDNILKLSTLRIKFKMPYLFDKTGREVIGLFFQGKLKIYGLLRHPVLLIHLTKLFSIY